MIRNMLVSATALLCMTVGSAQANTFKNTASTSPSAPQVVNGTVAGMPPTAQVLYAVVNSNGALARAFGGIVSSRQQVGVYRVRFVGRNISNCAWFGTIGALGTAVPIPGHTRTVLAAGTTDTVLVAVTNVAGNLADAPIHVQVTC